MGILEDIERENANKSDKYKSIIVEKHLDLEFDVGNLLAFDTNELDRDKLRNPRECDDYLMNLTRDNVQLLLNKVWELPTERREEAIVAKLPPMTYILPRSRPVPKPRKPTRWEEFAKLKGIQKKKKSKLSWDDQLKKWVPMYGYKRSKVEEQKDWIIEVPQNADPMEDQFAKKREAKSERVAKNELQRLRNIAKSKNVKIPRTGVLPEMGTSKEMNTAATIAKFSTASLGKFQEKLPREKEARGIAAMTPGLVSRKRKMAPVSGEVERQENLNVVEAVLSKRPKLNVQKAVNKHINEEQLQRSEEKKSTKPKAGKRGKKGGPAGGKKPKGSKGQRSKGKGSGRKRR